MKKKHTLLWLFPLLAVASYALVTFSVYIMERQEQAYQAARTKGWTTYLHQYSSSGSYGDLGIRSGEMIVDTQGRIWVAGGPSGLDGLHVFEGTRWTSYEGRYQDLALSPQGQVWAVRKYDGVVVLDAGQLISYSTADLDIEEGHVEQVEVDSNGRVWASVSIWGDAQVVEIVIQQGKACAVLSHPEFNIISGSILSLDADNTGRIWAGVQNFAGKTGQWTGLNVFDGQEWRHVLDQPDWFGSFLRVRADSHGRIWAITRRGNMLRYDGMEWETIPGMCCFDDFTLDNQGLVWGWEDNSIISFDNDGRNILNPENSGLDKRQIFSVVVDNLDRLWVGSSSGISMAPVENALTIPNEKDIQSHHATLFMLDRLDGLDWFLPALFAFLWLAAWAGALHGVLLAAAVGLLARFGLPGDYSILAAVGTFQAILLGFVGGLIDKERSKRGKKGKPWGYILAVIGLLFGFALGFFIFLLTLY